MRRILIPVVAIILVSMLSTFIIFAPSIQTVKAQTGISNSGLIAWWKLNEGKGTTVLDSSGNGYDGTINGCTWINKVGTNSLSFNGRSDNVNLPSFKLMNLNSLTVISWINSDLSVVGFIVFHGNLGTFEMGNGDLGQETQALNLNPTHASFSVKLSDSNWYGVSCPLPMEPNTWHQIVGEWIEGGSLKIYVDGVLAVETDNIENLGLFDSGNGFPNSLGVYAQNLWGQTDFFRGQMSNVMMYGRSLSNTEIQTLYVNQAVPILSSPTTSTVNPTANQTSAPTSTPTVPEFPTWIILPLVALSAFLSILFIKKSQQIIRSLTRSIESFGVH
jgi:hypothetical protein